MFYISMERMQSTGEKGETNYMEKFALSALGPS